MRPGTFVLFTLMLMLTAINIGANSPPTIRASGEWEYFGDYSVLTLDLRESYDSDGYISDIVIDWGDGTYLENEQLASHEYTLMESLLITVTIWDDDGYSSTQIMPIAGYTWRFEGTEIFVDANGLNENDFDFIWSWGDGSAESYGKLANHNFEPGHYRVFLEVIHRESGNKNGHHKNFNVEANKPPNLVYSISWENIMGDSIITVDMSNSYDVDGYIATHEIDWGDGEYLTDYSKAEHNYGGLYKSYLLSLFVVDEEGYYSTETIPIAGFKLVERGNYVELDAGNLPADRYSYTWDWGDGKFSEGRFASHTYSSGTYLMKLVVKDINSGLEGSRTHQFIINEEPNGDGAGANEPLDILDAQDDGVGDPTREGTFEGDSNANRNLENQTWISETALWAIIGILVTILCAVFFSNR